MTEQDTRGAGSHGTYGDSGSCGAAGWSVYRWNNDHFELEENHCGPGHSPTAPPTPSPTQRGQIEEYEEFRAIVCCSGAGSGGGGGSGSS